ncbi:MAG: hemerythrin domain-containing protein [Bacteroidales bacterium]
MNHLVYSSEMKMSDLILDNWRLIPVLNRFGIHLGFGEKRVSDVCAENSISTSLFLLICNVYTHEEYHPEGEELSSLDIEKLINYLQASHKYYLSTRVKEIERQLIQMSNCRSEKNNIILQRFFEDYRQELTNHFEFEERVVYPYIRKIVEHINTENLDIDKFEENHSNIEDKLSDLKSIIIKYLPEICSHSQRSELLINIFLLEEDLNRHDLIEDKILIPWVQNQMPSKGGNL